MRWKSRSKGKENVTDGNEDSLSMRRQGVTNTDSPGLATVLHRAYHCIVG